jgi:hypothetical protein
LTKSERDARYRATHVQQERDSSRERMVKYRQSNSYKEKQQRERDKKKMENARFIAWDGEGFNDEKGIHQYGLLMNSEGDAVWRAYGLNTMACFNALCDGGQLYPNAVHVCYGSSYDVNMLLRNIPMKVLKELMSGKERVPYKNFEMSYVPRREFTLTRYEPMSKHYEQTGVDKNGKPIFTSQNVTGKITLWDVIGFFQGSFLNALKTFFTQKELLALDYEGIKRGKERRGVFTPLEIEHFIIPYTTLEVKALVKLMERLQDYCLRAGIYLTRWDGAGAIASALLKQHHVKDYYGVRYDQPPAVGKCVHTKEIMDASLVAYGGGRVEMVKYGHFQGGLYTPYMKKIGIGPTAVHSYDLNSAYPSVLVDVPELSSGIWTHHTKRKDIQHELKTPSFSLWKVYWEFDTGHQVYPFFYRTWQDTIMYPSVGYSWVWYPELKAALDHKRELGGYIEIEEGYVYTPGTDIKPYAFISDLYTTRQRLKAEGHGMNIVYKLGYNSLYGKTVQHLGWSQDKPDEKPTFYQIQYGGWITAGCRANIFRAAMCAPDRVIQMATDGIFFNTEINLENAGFKEGTGLGEWEHHSYEAGTFVQSGVYFLTENGVSKPHYRGFDPNSILERDVLQAWQDGKSSLSVPSTRFVTLGTALTSEERFKTLWRTWHTDTRELTLAPYKLQGQKRVQDTSQTDNPSETLIPTRVNDMWTTIEWTDGKELSHAYPLPWAREEYETEDIREGKEITRERKEATWEYGED